MGSTGSGRFGDYKPSQPDKCDKAVEVELEEVGNSSFVTANKSVPTVGTPVHLGATSLNGRLIVEEQASGLDIGLLPTRLNFLKICQGKGHVYQGEVIASKATPIPTVRVRIESV